MAFDRRKLRAFLAVVDGGSLGRAASLANLSQPALSRLIRELEARFDQPLFERHTKGMALTAAGEALVPHARLLLFEMEQAQEMLASMKGLKRGTVRVGAVATIARSVLPPAVGALLEKAPGLRIDLLEAPDSRLVEALVDREIDFMIAAEIPANDEVETVAECRFDDVYSVFCAASHPLAPQGTVGIDALQAERWVMPKAGATPRALFEACFAEAGHRLPVIAVETGSIGAMIAFVANTRLLGWLPRPLLSGEQAGGAICLLHVDGLMIHRRFYVYRRRNGLLSQAAQQLLAELPLIG